MIVSHDLTILSMIMNASIVVKAVMLALVLASLFSWTYIFMKVFALRRAHRQAEAFEREFWSGTDLVGLRYRRPLEIVAEPAGEATQVVVPGEFVSAEDGTGLVHMAPFGADDYAVARAHGLAFDVPVDLAGRFSGSPVEQCARRAITGLRGARFQLQSQSLSVPVVLP